MWRHSDSSSPSDCNKIRDVERDILRRGGNPGAMFKARIHYMTWAWYTLTMSTGGLALLLYETPHRFRGLNTIGEIVFVFDLVCFVCITIGITTRFILFPKLLSSSLKSTSESLFFPAFWLSIATILSNTNNYGVPHCGPWLLTVLRVFFWLYTALSLLVAIFQYYHLFTASSLTTQDMTPAWLLPVFPAMLAGTISSAITTNLPPEHVLPIAVAGVTLQGLGFWVSILMYSIYIERLMSAGLPSANLRPGMFIAVGPPAFTSLALIGIAKNLSLPSSVKLFQGDGAAEAIRFCTYLALTFSIFLWTLAFWFFAIAVVAVLTSIHSMSFHLVWWALVFPNVGFTIATIRIGQQLGSPGILWVGSAMTILVVIVWLFVAAHHLMAVWRGKILFPSEEIDEDQLQAGKKR